MIKMLMLKIVAVTLMSAYIQSVGAGTGSEVAEFLLTTLASADSIVEAGSDVVDAYDKEAGKYRAVTYLEIDNYWNSNLEQGTLLLNKGLNKHSLDDQVKAGYRSGLAVSQNKPAHGGVEFIAFYTTEDGNEIIAVILKAYQKTAWRPSSVAGICVMEKKANVSYDNFDYWDEDSECLSQYDLNVVKVRKCCGKEFCALLDVTGNHHQPSATLSIYPLKANFLANYEWVKSELPSSGQGYLDDNVLNREESCFNFSPVVRLNMLLVISNLVIVMSF